MRTRNRYKFTLTAVLLDEVLFSQQVHPQISDLNMKYTKEANQVYYVPSFESALTFVETEFDLIVSQDIRAKFSLSMVDTYHIFSTKQMSFMRTDCEIDVNHKLITVTPKLFNPYKKLIDKRDEEYSVVDMGLNTKTLNFYLNTQLQVYAQEDNVISLIGLYGKGAQHSVTPNHYQLSLTYGEVVSGKRYPGMHFSGAPVVSIVIEATSSIDRYNGVFAGHATLFEFVDAAINNRYAWYGNGTWDRCACVQMQKVSGSGANDAWFIMGPDLWDADDDNGYWRTNYSARVRLGIASHPSNQATTYVPIIYDTINNAYSLVSGTTHNGATQFTCRIYVTYLGLVTGAKVDGFEFPSNERITEDITAEFNQNYKSRYPCGTNTYWDSSAMQYRVAFSHRTSDTPTSYGKVANTNLYYNTPDDTHYYLPVKKDSWFGGHSFWVVVNPNGSNGLTGFNNYSYYGYNPNGDGNVLWGPLRVQKSVADFYSFYDVIHGMLQKIAPEIVFLHDTAHSQFLFSQINPVTGISQLEKYMTQKSNVLKLDYDYPAWKAPLKWSQLEELLKNAFNCYTELFYDDSDNAWHLRIEHIKYFLNGHTYDADESSATIIDLVQAYDGFNREPLSFRTNKWKYDTESQADRYEFGWMDTQTEIFDGKPLIVTSEYSLYEDTKKEECKVSWFDTDIDFAMSVTSEISSDGFMLVSAKSNYFIEFINASTQANNPGMQNYSLSFDYLIPNFHLYNKYAEKMMIEGTEVLLNVVERKKMRIAEDIQFKVPENVEIQPSNLVKTEAGFAEIDSITIDMTDNSCTATLRYETL